MRQTAENVSGAARTPVGLSTWLNVNVWHWRLASFAIAGMVAASMVVVFVAWFVPSTDVWRHLADTVLGELVRNTAVLMFGVGMGVFALGVSLAWLTTTCDFPGRRLFDWALMLPLAIPAYVLAFIAVGLLDFGGPVQTWLRNVFGPGGYWFPKVRSEGGVIVVFVLAFYPYVYMLARAAFLSQGHAMLETARVFGLGPWTAFVRVAVPMARPAIAAGVALALMETLADFGAVSVFNYDTFTTAIYKVWFGLFNLNAAAQLASLLLLFVALALYGERRLRGKARYDVYTGNREKGYRLRGWRAVIATSFATLVLLLAFVIPVGQLLSWAWNAISQELDTRYLRFFTNTLLLGTVAAAITTSSALLLAYTYRLKPDRLTRAGLRFATLGYALPGSVLAVGIMLSFVWLDTQIAGVLHRWFDVSVGPLLTGSLLALTLAYVVRFMAVAHGPVDSAFESIKPSLLQAARSLGSSTWEILWRVFIPMLRAGLLSAVLLVFVEVMKEMPATLLLRPFGWDTLATRIFELTSEGEWERAALPAINLVLLGLIPVALLVRRSAIKP